MQRLKVHIILTEEIFIVSETLEQIPLWEPAATLTRHQGSWHTGNASTKTVRAGKVAVALDLALLT